MQKQTPPPLHCLFNTVRCLYSDCHDCLIVRALVTKYIWKRKTFVGATFDFKITKSMNKGYRNKKKAWAGHYNLIIIKSFSVHTLFLPKQTSSSSSSGGNSSLRQVQGQQWQQANTYISFLIILCQSGRTLFPSASAESFFFDTIAPFKFEFCL